MIWDDLGNPLDRHDNSQKSSRTRQNGFQTKINAFLRQGLMSFRAHAHVDEYARFAARNLGKTRNLISPGAGHKIA